MALSFVGTSNIINTNGTAPGAITPHANSAAGDLFLFFHYTAATGGSESVTIPGGFTSIFNTLSNNNGLVAAAWRTMVGGDTTFTATVANHTSGAGGTTILEWIETWRGHDTAAPIGNVSSSLSTWTTSTTNAGPIASTGISTMPAESVLIVHAGRHDDLATVAQTTLSGDSLTWTARNVQESTSGADAAMFTQSGLNGTGGTLSSFTSKTITGFGTADTATGAGIMFVVLAAGPSLPAVVMARVGLS